MSGLCSTPHMCLWSTCGRCHHQEVSSSSRWPANSAHLCSIFKRHVLLVAKRNILDSSFRRKALETRPCSRILTALSFEDCPGLDGKQRRIVPFSKLLDNSLRGLCASWTETGASSLRRAELERATLARIMNRNKTQGNQQTDQAQVGLPNELTAASS
jgi:hypothetical protein